MSLRDWRSLHHIDRPKLSAARLQAHYAVQWPARAARAYAAPQPDDSHTNLGCDDAESALVSHPFSNGIRVSLRIVSLTLAVHEDDKTELLHLDGRTDAEVLQWLSGLFEARGLDARGLAGPLPYELPPRPKGDNSVYDAIHRADGLAALVAWFADADLMLGRIRDEMIERPFDATPVRCWPHHFDMATLVSVPLRGGETGFVGAGFSPGDHYYDEPYFYVSVYPQPDPTTLPPLLKMGHWHTQDFTAAVATASDIWGAADQYADTDEFVTSAVYRAIEILEL